MMVIDMKHYQKVRQARLDAGMPVVTTETSPSALIGCRIVDEETNKVYTILKFMRHFHVDGWVYVAELFGEGGPTNVIWGNIDCESLSEEDFMGKKFFLLDETH